MEATLSSLISSNSSFSTLMISRGTVASTGARSWGVVVVAAGNRSNDEYGGRLVDEGMVQLRKRIHELKMLERSYEPPPEWADWEKRYNSSYESAVCQAVGVLQSLLMDARPSHAIAGAALVALSVPTAVALLAFYLVQSANGVLSGIQF